MIPLREEAVPDEARHPSPPDVETIGQGSTYGEALDLLKRARRVAVVVPTDGIIGYTHCSVPRSVARTFLNSEKSEKRIPSELIRFSGDPKRITLFIGRKP